MNKDNNHVAIAKKVKVVEYTNPPEAWCCQTKLSH